MARTYRDISADSHFESPPDQWAHRIPAQYRDRASRRIKLADGRDAIVSEGRPITYGGTSLYGGVAPEIFDPSRMDFDNTPGCGSAEQRLAEQDRDGIDDGDQQPVRVERVERLVLVFQRVFERGGVVGQPVMDARRGQPRRDFPGEKIARTVVGHHDSVVASDLKEMGAKRSRPAGTEVEAHSARGVERRIDGGRVVVEVHLHVRPDARPAYEG